jgi:hypothetical protein
MLGRGLNWHRHSVPVAAAGSAGALSLAGSGRASPASAGGAASGSAELSMVGIVTAVSVVAACPTEPLDASVLDTGPGASAAVSSSTGVVVVAVSAGAPASVDEPLGAPAPPSSPGVPAAASRYGIACGNGVERNRRRHLVRAFRDQRRNHDQWRGASLPPCPDSAALRDGFGLGALRRRVQSYFVGMRVRRGRSRIWDG